MKIHPLINSTDDLAALVSRMNAHDFVAVDTEFMRENTYWPDLCLVQVATHRRSGGDRSQGRGPRPRAAARAAGRESRRAEGLPRRRAGPGNHPQSDRQGAQPAVRHADRGDGARAMASRSAIRTWSKACSAIASTRARASPTGRAARSTSARSIMRSPTSPILPTIFPRAGQQAGQDRPRRLARRGDGAAGRPVELRLRARRRVEAPEAAQPQPGGARPPEGARRLARDRGAGRRTCRAAGSSRTTR